MRRLDPVWFDLTGRLLLGRLSPGDPSIVIAALDDETLDEHGLPPPRTFHARLLDALKRHGARTVAFDVWFSDPREGDRELAKATAGFGRAVHAYVMHVSASRAGVEITVELPRPELREAAQGLGFVNVSADPDGRVRGLFVTEPNLLSPHERERGQALLLAAAGVRSFRGLPHQEIEARFGGASRYLNFRRAFGGGARPAFSPYRIVSAARIVSGRLSDAEKAALQDALVFVGSTSQRYADHFPTPMSPRTPGVLLQATAADNILHDDFLRVPPATVVLAAVLAMVWLPWLLAGRPPAVGVWTAGGLLAFWPALSAAGLLLGWRFGPVAPAAALVCSWLVQAAFRPGPDTSGPPAGIP